MQAYLGENEKWKSWTNHRIRESWKGALQIINTTPLLTAESTRVGCPGPCPDAFEYLQG